MWGRNFKKLSELLLSEFDTDSLTVEEQDVIPQGVHGKPCVEIKSHFPHVRVKKGGHVDD